MNLTDSKDVARRFLIFPLTLLVTLAYVEVCLWTVRGVDYQGPGAGQLNLVFAFYVGYIFFRHVNGHINSYWSLTWSARLRPAARAAAFMLWLPACILIGRFTFMYIPPFDTTIGCIFGILLFLFLFWMDSSTTTRPADEVIRGTRLLFQEHANAIASELARESAEPDIAWAGLKLPATTAELNFCVVGTKGSGKTLMMQGLMRSVLPSISRGRDRRALIYDVKTEWLSFLYSLGLAESIRILNPLDIRCCAWDLANDMQSLAEADQFGQVLIPPRENDHNPFFDAAAQSLIAGIVKTLMLTAGPTKDAPARWTLRDLTLIAGHPSRLRWVLLRKAKGTIIRDLVPQFLKALETYHNIISSIALAVVPLQVTAGIWDRLPRERKISLRNWATRGDTILVMSQAPMYEKPLAALNRVMFKFISDAANSDPNVHPHQNRLWFFCDELKEAGNLDGLAKMLNDGRSKGIRAAIGFQDIEGFRHEYGEKLANELPTTCSNLSFLRTESPFTQKWASETIGPVQKRRVTASRGSGTDGQGHTTTNQGESEQVVIEEAVIPSELRQLPLSENGMVSGYHIVPKLHGVVRNDVHYEYARNDPFLNFSPRNDTLEQQLPPPWTREDAERLWPGETFPDSLFQDPDDDQEDTDSRPFMPRVDTLKPGPLSPLDAHGRVEVD